MSFSGADTLDMATPEAKRAAYELLLQQARALFDGERNMLANLAQFSALVYHALPGLNWAGFYMARGNGLVLGPFQGKVACVRIPVGKGVCGTAVAEARSQLVADVHAFPGHIACDAASRSEVVVPLIHAGAVLGVLDLDSPSPGRFTAEDQAGFEALAALYVAGSDF